MPHRSWYTGHWLVGCYIWYSEEPGQAVAPPSPLLAVPNVAARPSTASVPITVLLCDGPLLCGFNVAIKRLNKQLYKNTQNRRRQLKPVCQQWQARAHKVHHSRVAHLSAWLQLQQINSAETTAASAVTTEPTRPGATYNHSSRYCTGLDWTGHHSRCVVKTKMKVKFEVGVVRVEYAVSCTGWAICTWPGLEIQTVRQAGPPGLGRAAARAGPGPKWMCRTRPSQNIYACVVSS